MSSFGISGTNAHVILEEVPPASRGIPAGRPPWAVLPWVVTGRGADGLRAQAARLAGFARQGCGGADAADVAWSLATGRPVLEDRAVVLAADGCVVLRPVCCAVSSAAMPKHTTSAATTIFPALLFK